jgi:hypothetical protein
MTLSLFSFPRFSVGMPPWPLQRREPSRNAGASSPPRRHHSRDTAPEIVKVFGTCCSRSLDGAQRNPGLGHKPLIHNLSAMPAPDSAALHPGYIGHAPNTFTVSPAVSRLCQARCAARAGGRTLGKGLNGSQRES